MLPPNIRSGGLVMRRLQTAVRVLFLTFAVLGTGAAVRAQSVDTFDPGANAKVEAMAVQADGKIVVGGQFSLLGGGGAGLIPRNRIGRFNVDGSLDLSFNPGVFGATVLALAVQADGKILVAGTFTMVAGAVRNNIARLNPDGLLDTGFNPGSSGSVYEGEIDALAVQPDGKILAGGEFLFLGGGVGTTSRNRIGRLNADGSLDATFNPGANSAVVSLVVQPDGKIVVGGVFTTLGGATRNRIGRLNANGTLDTFNPGTTLGAVTAVALQADGKILVGGDFTGLGGGTGTTPRNKIGRLNADGSVDAFFNPGATGSVVYTIGVQADGKILVGGSFTALGTGGTTPRGNIGRLNPDGSPDLTFDPGANATVEGILVQPDGLVLVGGPFTGLGGGTGTTVRNRIGRLTNTDAAIQSLSLNGIRSVVTWMRSGAAPEVVRVTFDWSINGLTYTPLGVGTRVAGGWQLAGQSLPNQDLYIRARGYYATAYENASGSIAESILNVPRVRSRGDFDGDGRADVTVFRPSTGVWHTVSSSTGTPTAFAWGNSADRPVVGDYDGDGRTDIAVFRPSNGTWYVVPSTTGVPYGFAWGNSADIPVPGDYDGDKKTDMAVFRPSTGTWYVVPSTIGAPYGFAWGNGADITVPADYDGDGKTDIAVFRPSNGTWYVVPSTTGVPYGFAWGNSADTPVPADFDGDGKTDIAVFRPSNGTWYVVPSTTGVPYGFAWGNAADVPIFKRP